MKNLKTILAGLALVLISGAAWATGNMKVNIVSTENNRTTVQIINVADSFYELELQNEYGDVVFYKRTKTSVTNYSKQYDFSKLDDGNYKLTVQGTDEKMENNLSIKKGQVEVLNQTKEIEPFFALNDNRLELSWLNFEQENLRILIYDKSNLLFEKKLEPNFAVNYALDLSKLKSGNYDAVLVTEDSYFEYQVTKK